MAGRLDGRVAIITGGGHGIGRAYAHGMAREGARVLVAEINAKAGDVVAAELKTLGHDAVAVRTDVADEASCHAMAQRAVDAWGKIDILVNNAAIFATIPMSRAPFDRIPIEEWDRMMAVNLRGTWLASRACIEHMKQRGYGKIITISSGTAIKGSAGRIHYVTSKAGIIGFTRVLAREVGEHGICVNCIAPGSTLSEANPGEDVIRMRTAAKDDRALRRVQTPEDIVGRRSSSPRQRVISSPARRSSLTAARQCIEGEACRRMTSGCRGLSNSALERTAGSHALATAAHREH